MINANSRRDAQFGRLYQQLKRPNWAFLLFENEINGKNKKSESDQMIHGEMFVLEQDQSK